MPEEIFFDRVLAEVRSRAIWRFAQAFGYEGDDLLFARGEDGVAARVEDADGGDFGDYVH